MSFDAYAGTDVGLERDHNEDYALVDEAYAYAIPEAFDDASATELAGDQSFPPSPLASTLGAPDGTWAVDVSMQPWGQMTIGYRCDGASGSASVTPATLKAPR